MRQLKQPAIPDPMAPEPLQPDSPFPPDFALLGLCYDKTQTLRKGAAVAPRMLRNAFPKLETFVHGVDLTEVGLDDLGDIVTDNADQLHKHTATRLGRTRKFPIILGGEHSVSLAAVKALKPDTVIILDAHPDCESGKAHDSVTRRIAEHIGSKNVILFGPRTISAAEAAYLKSSGIHMVNDSRKLPKMAKGKVYLSVDLDVLDPSIMASVGNPEPMGLSFSEVSQAIHSIAPKLVAADFVEFTPVKHADLARIHALMAGKLIYSTMAAVVKAKRK